MMTQGQLIRHKDSWCCLLSSYSILPLRPFSNHVKLGTIFISFYRRVRWFVQCHKTNYYFCYIWRTSQQVLFSLTGESRELERLETWALWVTQAHAKRRFLILRQGKNTWTWYWWRALRFCHLLWWDRSAHGLRSASAAMTLWAACDLSGDERWPHKLTGKGWAAQTQVTPQPLGQTYFTFQA
jgi:hypothetical protein